MRRTLLVLAVVVAMAVGFVRQPRPPIRDGAPRTVAILGDSVARGAGDETGRGMASYLPDVAVMNLGIDGARTYTVLRHVRKSSVARALSSADAVIVSIGGNDLFGDSRARLFSTFAPELSMRRAISRVKRVVAAVRRENASARIYLLGLYNPYRAAWLDPHISRWDSRLIAAFADAPGVTVIRVADLLDEPRMLSPIDKFHPSSAGYRAVAGRVVGGWWEGGEGERSPQLVVTVITDPGLMSAMAERNCGINDRKCGSRVSRAATTTIPMSNARMFC